MKSNGISRVTQALRIVDGMREEAAKVLNDNEPRDVESLIADLRDELLGNGATTSRATRPTKSTGLNQPVPLCQLKISLDGIRPQIWRRIVVPHTISLEGLHNVIQIAMGWTNSHLHSFKANGLEYQINYDEFDYDPVPQDEDLASLDMLVSKSKDRFEYVYDFGDNWQHTIVVERMLPFWSAPNAPICLDGAYAAPPEDCGSTMGYLDLRRILKNPKHADYTDMRQWAGKKFDPLKFDIIAVNKRIELYRKKGRLTDAMLPDIRMS